MGYVDVRLAPKDAADEEIKTQIGVFVSENLAPRNIMIISGDHGFKKKLYDVNGGNYKTLAAFRNRAAAEDKMNAVVYDSWFWRMLLGLTKTKNSKKRKREERGVVNLSPTAYVNGSYLAKFIGQKVKTIVEIVGSRDGLLA